jgi:uncharacterized protein (DUF302 family)
MSTSTAAIPYGYLRTVSLSFEKALQDLESALNKEGFGVLFRLDMKEKFREKLGVEFRRYVILGACNPPIAYQALGEEIGIGLLLPCNAVVFEDGARVVVGVVDAAKMLSIAGNAGMSGMAEEVSARLRRAVDSLPGAGN